MLRRQFGCHRNLPLGGRRDRSAPARTLAPRRALKSGESRRVLGGVAQAPPGEGRPGAPVRAAHQGVSFMMPCSLEVGDALPAHPPPHGKTCYIGREFWPRGPARGGLGAPGWAPASMGPPQSSPSQPGWARGRRCSGLAARPLPGGRGPAPNLASGENSDAVNV